jgi:hypothetical protein
MSKIFAAALAALVCALAAPAIASAATAGVANGVLSYNAAPGEANHLSITYNSGKYYVNDTGAATLVAGSGCSLYQPQWLTCNATGITSFSVDLGDSNDWFSDIWTALPATVHGGIGDDQIYTGLANDHLYGDAGNDTLNGGWGDDYIEGGQGNDTLTGDVGNDTINAVDSGPDTVTCGSQTDTVQADAVDTVNADCETVQRAGAGSTTTTDPGTTGTDPGSSTTGGSTGGYGTTVIQPPVVQFSPAPAVLLPNGNVTLKLRCPAEIFDGCEGTITLQIYLGGESNKKVSAARRRKLVKLATRHFKMAAGRSQNLVVHMARRGRRAFERHPRQKVIATITMNTPSGPTTTTHVITVQRRSYRNAPGFNGRHR